jgi:alanine dehydrogenase
MKIGCIKEIKNNEFRVGLTPDNVRSYVAAGHHVYMEKGAGIGSGFSDNEYVDAGACLSIKKSIQSIFVLLWIQ